MAFALIVTIVGFLLLLDKLNLISGEVWGLFWPLVIIAIGLSMMYHRMNNQHLFGDCCQKQPAGQTSHRKGRRTQHH